MSRVIALVAVALWALSAATHAYAQADLERFGRLAARLSSSDAGPKSDPIAEEAMEIVIGRSARAIKAGPRAMESAASPFVEIARRAADPEGPPATRYGRLTVRAAAASDVAAMTVTCGAVTRLAAFRRSTGKRLAVPGSASWMFPWSARPVVSSDGTVALIAESVQDAGMRTSIRMDVVSVGASGLRRTVTASLARLLDWGGFRLNGDRLTMTGIEPPRSFMTTSPERLFTVVREYRLGAGTARVVREELGQPEVRCVDRWLAHAYAVSKPTGLQKRVLDDFPEMGVIETWRVAGSRSRPVVELAFPDGVAKFTLARGRALTVTGYSLGK